MKPNFKILLMALIISSTAACDNSKTGTQENDSKQVVETIMTRRSIRKYKPEPVSREILDVILECGINAPSALNKQSWELRILDNPALIEKFCSYLINDNSDLDANTVRECLRGAPTLVFVANDQSFSYSAIDCGLLSENIVLAAHSLGLGSICLGSPVHYLKNSPDALSMLAFSDGYAPILCIGLGTADESPDARPRDKSKIKFVE